MRRTIRSTIYDFMRYGLFSKREIILIIVTGFIFGFIFAFRSWGDTTFDAGQGLYYWFLYSLFSIIPLAIMQLGHRFAAVHFGYIPEYNGWRTGLVTSLFFCFATNGYFIFLTPGGFTVDVHQGMKAGRFHKGVVFYEKSYMVFFGLLALVIYGGLVKLLPLDPSTLGQITRIAFIIGAYSLLPVDLLTAIFHRSVILNKVVIPPSNGSILLFGGRPFAAFTIVFFFIAFLSNEFLSLTGSFIISLTIATLAYGIWILFIDPNRLWKT